MRNFSDIKGESIGLLAEILGVEDSEKPVILKIKTREDTYIYGDGDPIEHWEYVGIRNIFVSDGCVFLEARQ